jgi:hypothetical protein
MDNRYSIPGTERFLYLSLVAYRLWAPTMHLPIGYLRFLPRGQSGRGMKLTTHSLPDRVTIIIDMVNVNYRMSWSIGYYACIVFESSRVQISARKRLSWLRSIVVFLSPTSRMPGLYLGHDRFLTHPFQFIIHLWPYHLTVYSHSYSKSVVN